MALILQCTHTHDYKILNATESRHRRRSHPAIKYAIRDGRLLYYYYYYLLLLLLLLL